MFRLSLPSFTEWAVALAVFVYLSSMVLVPGAYGFAPAILLILSLVCFRAGAVRQVLESGDWKFLAALVSYALFAIALMLWHGDSLSTFDRPSRFIVAALILTFLLRVRLSPLTVFSGAAVGGVATGLFSAYQVIAGGVGRVTSFDNAIYFGNGSLVLALVAFCGFIYSLQEKRWSRLWTLLFAAGFSGALLGVIFSGTRGGWLAVPVIFLLAVWTYRRFVFRHPGVLGASVAALILFGVAVVSLDVVTKRVDVAFDQAEAYFEEGKVDTSVGLRLEMWRAGWLLFTEHPLAGVGDDQFDQALRSLVEQGRVDEGILTFRHLHNQFVDHAAKGGILAVLSLLLVLLVPMRLFASYLNSGHPLIAACALMGTAFTLSFTIFCLTQGMFSRNIGIMMYVIVPLLAWTMIRQADSGSSRRWPEPDSGTGVR